MSERRTAISWRMACTTSAPMVGRPAATGSRQSVLLLHQPHDIRGSLGVARGEVPQRRRAGRPAGVPGGLDRQRLVVGDAGAGQHAWAVRDAVTRAPRRLRDRLTVRSATPRAVVYLSAEHRVGAGRAMRDHVHRSERERRATPAVDRRRHDAAVHERDV